jgi:hypothetical protein
MVYDAQFQAHLGPEAVSLFRALQLILSAAHGEQAEIGSSDDTVEIRHLYVSFQFNLLFPFQSAVRGVGQGFHPYIFFLYSVDAFLPVPDL